MPKHVTRPDEPASPAQIGLLKKLGVTNLPYGLSKGKASEMIKDKMGTKEATDNPSYEPRKAGFNAAQDSAVVVTAKHDVIIQRTEKPHSFEFGKAGARHKIYYNTVEELKNHIKLLEEEKLYFNDLSDKGLDVENF